MKKQVFGVLLAAASASQAVAQQAAESLPVVPTVRPNVQQAVLPPNTEIAVAMNEDLTTKGGKIDVGYKFGLSVTHDVMLGEYVVIPKGTPAVGEVTWRTGKGAFGKSGKMEIELRYIDLNGRRIPIEGKYRQEGEGNTVGTVAGVVAAGVFAAVITGKSARIPQGRELKAFTKEAVPVQMPAAAGVVTGVPAVARQPIEMSAPGAGSGAAPAKPSGI